MEEIKSIQIGVGKEFAFKQHVFMDKRNNKLDKQKEKKYKAIF